MACVIRVLGKPELSNAIRLNELEIVMSNFLPQQHLAEDSNAALNSKAGIPDRNENSGSKGEDGSNKKREKRRNQFIELFRSNKLLLEEV